MRALKTNSRSSAKPCGQGHNHTTCSAADAANVIPLVIGEQIDSASHPLANGRNLEPTVVQIEPRAGQIMDHRAAFRAMPRR